MGMKQPWTTDRCFQQYRFCNIFRELDRTSKWINTNWSLPFSNHKMLPLALAIARRLNWPPTLAAMGFPRKWNESFFIEFMKQRKADGNKLVTSAHQVSRGTGRAGESVDFIQQCAELFTRLHALNNTWVLGSLQETYHRLCELDGFAHFTAYELVTELSHTKWLKNAEDHDTWCVIKEGSHRGLNRVMRRYEAPTSKWLNRGRVIGQQELITECIELRNLAIEKLQKKDSMFKTLTLRNIEDSLCEFDKYCRAIENNGAGMRKFRPDVDRPF